MNWSDTLLQVLLYKWFEGMPSQKSCMHVKFSVRLHNYPWNSAHHRICAPAPFLCIQVNTHVHIVHTHTHIHSHTQTQTHTLTHARTHTHTHARMRAHTYTHVPAPHTHIQFSCCHWTVTLTWQSQDACALSRHYEQTPLDMSLSWWVWASMYPRKFQDRKMTTCQVFDLTTLR